MSLFSKTYLTGLGMVLLFGAGLAIAPETRALQQGGAPKTGVNGPRQETPRKEDAPPPVPDARPKDEDRDGLPDELEQKLATGLFPSVVHFDVAEGLEGCPAPVALKKKKKRPSALVYRLAPHPVNPKALILTYAFLYGEDCGAPTGLQHSGDVEGLAYTLVRDNACPLGWRIHEARTRVFVKGEPPRFEKWTPRRDAPCEHPPKLFVAARRHSNFFDEKQCRDAAKMGTGCSNGPVVEFQLHNAGEPDAHPEPAFMNGLEPEFPGERVWDGRNNDPGFFCGGNRPCTRNEPCTSRCCRDDVSVSPCLVGLTLVDRELVPPAP